jgi:hypothetical protein
MELGCVTSLTQGVLMGAGFRATAKVAMAPPTDSLSWFLRGDITWRNKQYVEEMNLAWIPDRTLVNASVGISVERATAGVTLNWRY